MAHGEFPFHAGRDHGRGVPGAVQAQRQFPFANDALGDPLAPAIDSDQLNRLRTRAEITSQN